MSIKLILILNIFLGSNSFASGAKVPDPKTSKWKKVNLSAVRQLGADESENHDYWNDVLKGYLIENKAVRNIDEKDLTPDQKNERINFLKFAKPLPKDMITFHWTANTPTAKKYIDLMKVPKFYNAAFTGYGTSTFAVSGYGLYVAQSGWTSLQYADPQNPKLYLIRLKKGAPYVSCAAYEKWLSANLSKLDLVRPVPVDAAICFSEGLEWVVLKLRGENFIINDAIPGKLAPDELGEVASSIIGNFGYQTATYNIEKIRTNKFPKQWDILFGLILSDSRNNKYSMILNDLLQEKLILGWDLNSSSFENKNPNDLKANRVQNFKLMLTDGQDHIKAFLKIFFSIARENPNKFYDRLNLQGVISKSDYEQEIKKLAK